MNAVSRTKSNPRYKEVNDKAGKRQDYRKKLTVAWMKANKPEVWDAICEESYLKYPSPEKLVASAKEVLEGLKRIGGK